MTTASIIPETLTIDEAAAFLHVERSTVKKLIRVDPGFPHVRISERVIRIPRWMLVKWIEDKAGGDA